MPEHAKHNADAKVVHLEPESQRIVRAKLASLPAAVHSVHEKGGHVLMGLIKAFFDRADDSLFELADKANSNDEQNLYFDAMREVRVQRRGIEKRFADAIDLAFAELMSESGLGDSAHKFSPDSLSLVEHEELDEMLAVDTSIARAHKLHGESIQLISLRLDSLLPVKVYQKNNPFGPDMICSTFMDEVKKLDVGIRSKLVLFKLFDRAVISKLKELFDTANGVLLEHNILPSLSSRSAQSTLTAGAKVSSASLDDALSATAGSLGNIGAGVSADASMSPEVLSKLKNILGEKVIANPAASTQSLDAASQLMSLLSHIQHMPNVMDNRIALNVRSLLEQLQQQKGVDAQIGQVDDQVINLVNMLFEFILDDRSLAAPMKALLSRMQIPIIKVAVADKAFFTKGNHVARRLLNDMASAAMGWAGDEVSATSDPLYRKIESIVRRLMEDFDNDLRIFSELLTDFTAFTEKEKKRAAVLERRTIDAEDGKAKAELARTTVELEIEIRTVGLALPSVVNDLIKNAWNNVLFVTALKYGYESEEWQSQLVVLEDLVWSAQVPRAIEQRQKLIKLVPGLLKRLRRGLDIISFNPFEMSDMFKSLEKVHISCIRGRAPVKPVAPPVTESTSSPVNPQATSQQATDDLPASQAPAQVDSESTESGSGLAQSPPKRPVPRKVTEGDSNISLPEPSLRDLANAVEIDEINDSNADAFVHLPPDDPYMKQVAGFSQGVWFEMKNDKGDANRVRLAAVIRPVGKYIFVNRNGMKVAEHSQVELANMLKNNAIRTLDDTMLFDRALETVVTGLRKN
ncbi:MAG: DUF1631 domain-containing protein [Agarilytica sp.]